MEIRENYRGIASLNFISLTEMKPNQPRILRSTNGGPQFMNTVERTLLKISHKYFDSAVFEFKVKYVNKV